MRTSRCCTSGHDQCELTGVIGDECELMYMRKVPWPTESSTSLLKHTYKSTHVQKLKYRGTCEIKFRVASTDSRQFMQCGLSSTVFEIPLPSKRKEHMA